MQTPPSAGERPIVVRGALLVLGLFVVAMTVAQWRAAPVDGPRPGVAYYLLPLLLASSLVVQFFAKTRNSPLLLVSLGLVAGTLILLWLVSTGRV